MENMIQMSFDAAIVTKAGANIIALNILSLSDETLQAMLKGIDAAKKRPTLQGLREIIIAEMGRRVAVDFIFSILGDGKAAF
jgi:hypothetical protein